MIGSFLTVGRQIITLYLLLAVGYALGKVKLIDDRGSLCMSNLVMYVVSPCMMLVAFQRPLERELLHEFAIMLGVALLLHAAFIVLSRLLIREKDAHRRGLLLFGAVFSNCGFMGYPLMTALFAFLTQVPGMVVAWQHPIPRYTVEYFWRLRLKMWKELLTLPTGELPQMGFVDPLLLLYGLGAAVSTLPFAIRTRDLLLQTLIWYFAGNTALWALGVSIPAVGCLPLMVCVWDYWGQREGTLNATIGAIFLLCAAVAGRVLLFLSGM